MIIWGHNYIQYKKLFFPCVLFVCVWCKDNCMSASVCAPMEAREMPGVFSPWLSALLPLAWALTRPEACLCNLVCWQSTPGSAFPSVLESLGCSVTLSLLHGRWDSNSGPLAFRVLFPTKPRFLLKWKAHLFVYLGFSTKMCFSSWPRWRHFL